MITVLGYDASWPNEFVELAGRYRGALAGVAIVAIEHIGSTAVPGLAAKPVIDIDIVVEPAAVTDAATALGQLGYTARGELGIEHRWAFMAPPHVRPTNTYVVIEGSLAHRNHIAVRDVLRSDAALRDEYGALKRRLAETSDDIESYVEGKSALLSVILERAGLDATDRATVEQANRARRT